MRPGEPEPLLPRRASGLLRTFSDAGVLGLADVHTADRVATIAGERDPEVALALALTVRALRAGSVCVDLRRVRDTVYDEAEALALPPDGAGLPWPEPESWLERCRCSPLVTDGAELPSGRPLRLAFGQLYLERYWQQEELVRLELERRRAAGPPPMVMDRLTRALDRIFGASDGGSDGPDLQRVAAAVSAQRRVSVIAGGPGTGKTTTVARLLALLRDQPGRPVRIALAAPTGKAAARLEEAVRAARAGLATEDRDRLGDVRASTLHRLLGWLPGSRGRFRHNASNRLPFEVVVVDEMSMVSLTLMARLLEAVRPDARLVLVGDPDQLSSVEAGAVLADIASAPGQPSTAEAPVGVPELPSDVSRAVGRGVVTLQRTWRFGGAIFALARAIRAGDADQAVAVLRSGGPGLEFAEVDLGHADQATLSTLAAEVRASGQAVRSSAASGEVDAALRALEQHRLLCAHRGGPYGVSRWSAEVERWLAAALPGYGSEGEWYLGRPLLVTANDYELGLYNGDTGVVVATPAGPRAAFARGAAASLFAPVRLEAVQTVHAMTVHRAQGSQFRHVSFVLPPQDSPLLTRELLYTAVTRATDLVRVLGTEAAVRRAVGRPANRASGLRNRLS